MVCSALGVDGGAIFQIFATEDLHLGATAIGIAFGLGALSVPVQLWAARMPLWRARRNLQVFLLVAAAQAWILAVLVATGSTGGPAVVALAVTVMAEISVSVLFATAWQPLLSQVLSSVERQQINSRGRAAGGALLAVSVLVFAALNQTMRAAFLLALGATAVWSAARLSRIDVPGRPPAPPRAPAVEEVLHGQPVPAGMRLIYLVFALVGLGAWPLLLVYVDKVLWPGANLGVVGAVQLVGVLASSLAWRPTADRVVARARLGGVALLASAMVLAALRAPVDRGAEVAALLAAVVVAAAATSTVRLALLELAHRAIDESSTVRAFTILDVVASTSLQLGLLAGGLLVAWSASIDWAVDPYRIYVVVCAVATLAAISRIDDADRVIR